MSKHTPGPYRIDDATFPHIWIQAEDDEGTTDDGGVRLERNRHGSGNPAVTLSPAYAAAPELLEACKMAMATCSPYGQRFCREAIAKAEGGGE